ncbi:MULTISPECIES: heme exporter protein CcmB [Pseudoalteromonas]|jgi:heme exporter protein B|uniref:Heme exporter protein B n=1 Tax=Pseudoalteromonas carrageenovora IAM 12662 TaxID=1314868 RepID=A0A2K4X7I2_PSEVC|nr:MULTISPECIES: heme exporter protein CcmB [Pseudoalteromonas]MBE0382496.1 heme exporter protein B [Pseudoalteromonas carrageenovora IAM 12662]MBQ4798178.1 heme exporter protein CcmB [Pseudoalteromonas sp. MMG006]MCQ8890108.1 heme exporter protein CcmB [Pseudoalteromonas carrageenovora]MDO6464050.1 heme exporter protein CcmB [Pseudoalteromonas carrageenovora]MDO6547475.1 heme exporter protein CcmB [Pseudoalteromonas carrageenovora]|tara:strand:- start:4 stop:690 length:687 start_codon:yes stop_codon:yes gene_type:complete
MTRQHSYWQLFSAVFSKDVKLAFRQRAEIVNPILFFLIVISLFPLAIGPEPGLLARMAPGIIWVAALLSTMLGLDKLFRDDYNDGSLEQLIASSYPLSLSVLGKVAAHWVVTGLPLVLMTPLFALLLNLESQSLLATVLTLLLGTPLLSFIGAIGAGLTVGLQKGGILMSLLVLPLYIPVLIFATSAIDTSSMSLDYSGQLAILGAMLVIAIISAPIAISSALKVSVS